MEGASVDWLKTITTLVLLFDGNVKSKWARCSNAEEHGILSVVLEDMLQFVCLPVGQT
jgi:hypothetical protein